MKNLIFCLPSIFLIGCSSYSNKNIDTEINNELDTRNFISSRYCDGEVLLAYSKTKSSILAKCNSGTNIRINSFKHGINSSTLNESARNFDLFKEFNGCSEQKKYHFSEINIRTGGDYPYFNFSSKGRCSDGSRNDMNIEVSAKKSILTKFTNPMPSLLNNTAEYLHSVSEQLCRNSDVSLNKISTMFEKTYLGFSCDGSKHWVSTDVPIDTVATYATLDCPLKGFKKFNAAQNHYGFECK